MPGSAELNLSAEFGVKGTKALLLKGFAANVMKRWYQREPLRLPGEFSPRKSRITPSLRQDPRKSPQQTSSGGARGAMLQLLLLLGKDDVVPRDGIGPATVGNS